MIINDEAKKKILDIIDAHFNAIVLKIAGREGLTREQYEELTQLGLISPELPVSIIEDAYYIGRVRPVATPPKSSLDKVRLERLSLPMTDAERFALKHVKESVGEHITKLRDMVRTSLSQNIGKQNLLYRNKVLTEVIRPIIEEGIVKRKAVNAVATALRDKTTDFFRDFQRIAETEMTNAVNWGAYDAIAKKNVDKKPTEVMVAKIAKMDDALCPYCKKFFVGKGGSPKVYSLAELQGNGDNYGRKSKEWEPVIGAVHPRCRCQLIEILPGWQFKSGSQTLEYVGVGKENWR
jgi:hypothetical protein